MHLHSLKYIKNYLLSALDISIWNLIFERLKNVFLEKLCHRARAVLDRYKCQYILTYVYMFCDLFSDNIFKRSEAYDCNTNNTSCTYTCILKN